MLADTPSRGMTMAWPRFLAPQARPRRLPKLRLTLRLTQSEEATALGLWYHRRAEMLRRSLMDDPMNPTISRVLPSMNMPCIITRGGYVFVTQADLEGLN